MSLTVNITDENKENFIFLMKYFEGRFLTRKQVKANFENDNSTVFITVHDLEGLLTFLFNESQIADFKQLVDKLNLKNEPKYFGGILQNLIQQD